MDIELHFQESGVGPPLLLLHGNGEDGSYFRHQMEHFQDRCRVIALDTRGHGGSPRGTAPFTIAQFSKDLYDFTVGKGLRDPIILGFSDGANIAMRFALDHPGLARALILCGGNLNPRGVKRSTQLPIEVGYRIASRFANRSPQARRNAELLGLMVNEPNIAPEELAAITVPTLVICGSRDMIKLSHTKEIAAHIPGAKLAVVKGDHFVANRNPAAFDRVVEDFLNTL